MGAARTQKKKDVIEYSSSLPPPPRDKLPVTLLLQMQYFEQLFSLMQSLSAIKTSDRSGVSPRTINDNLFILVEKPYYVLYFFYCEIGCTASYKGTSFVETRLGHIDVTSDQPCNS